LGKKKRSLSRKEKGGISRGRQRHEEKRIFIWGKVGGKWGTQRKKVAGQRKTENDLKVGRGCDGGDD